MEKLKKVKMLLLDKSQIDASEVLDIGQYYYIALGKNVQTIKKSDVAQISWESKVVDNDNSKYVKD
ncbi:MAG: hypothetical protein DRQ78_07640 [Epsilonproteobacteria bacterium]|nr:MAG: hypothetical protein DRQ78_07640 [Campylobacterota bacterium]